MDYRDERDALRAKVGKLEDDLARADATIADLRGQSRARRLRFAKRATVGALGLAALLAVAAAATLVYRRSTVSPVPPIPLAPSIPSAAPIAPFALASHPPMFALINADDRLDPVVWGTSGDSSCLAGFDIQTAARLWLTCPYPEYAEGQVRSALIGNRVLVEFERNLDAFDVKTGTKLWTTRLDERTMEYCLRPDGSLRITLQEGTAYLLAPETGKLTPSTRTYDCQATWNDWRWGSRSLPGQHVAEKAYFSFGPHNPAPVLDGVVPEMVVRHGDRTIVLGYRRPGAHVPVAVALGETGTPLWTRDLPPNDSGLADEGGPPYATLGDHRLCAPYRAKQGFRLGCWDPARGTTLWDVPINVSAFQGIAFTEHNLILVYFAKLGVFDLANGSWLHDIP